MTKINKEIILEFVQTNAIELKCTHTKLCVPIIERLYRKMKGGIKFSPINVVVESGLIMDGHHRYLASQLANYDLERIPTLSNSETKVTDWKFVDFIDDDWDTDVKIQMLNRQDALYSGVSIERIENLLK